MESNCISPKIFSEPKEVKMEEKKDDELVDLLRYPLRLSPKKVENDGFEDEEETEDVKEFADRIRAHLLNTVGRDYAESRKFNPPIRDIKIEVQQDCAYWIFDNESFPLGVAACGDEKICGVTTDIGSKTFKVDFERVGMEFLNNVWKHANTPFRSLTVISDIEIINKDIPNFVNDLIQWYAKLSKEKAFESITIDVVDANIFVAQLHISQTLIVKNLKRQSCTEYVFDDISKEGVMEFHISKGGKKLNVRKRSIRDYPEGTRFIQLKKTDCELSSEYNILMHEADKMMAKRARIAERARSSNHHMQ